MSTTLPLMIDFIERKYKQFFRSHTLSLFKWQLTTYAQRVLSRSVSMSFLLRPSLPFIRSAFVISLYCNTLPVKYFRVRTRSNVLSIARSWTLRNLKTFSPDRRHEREKGWKLLKGKWSVTRINILEVHEKVIKVRKVIKHSRAPNERRGVVPKTFLLSVTFGWISRR
jgi:hypothetical protein